MSPCSWTVFHGANQQGDVDVGFFGVNLVVTQPSPDLPAVKKWHLALDKKLEFATSGIPQTREILNCEMGTSNNEILEVSFIRKLDGPRKGQQAFHVKERAHDGNGQQERTFIIEFDPYTEANPDRNTESLLNQLDNLAEQGFIFPVERHT